MKKLLIFSLVLLMAASANAALWLSVNGAENPTSPIVLEPGQTCTIGIHGDGMTLCTAFWLCVQGAGSIDDHTMVYGGNSATYADHEDMGSPIDPPEPSPLPFMEEALGLTDLRDLAHAELFDNVQLPVEPLSLDRSTLTSLLLP